MGLIRFPVVSKRLCSRDWSHFNTYLPSLYWFWYCANQVEIIYANVGRVSKCDQKSNPCNYRPISLTCIASKVLEHIVHSHVMKDLDSHQILTDVQHGFRAKRLISDWFQLPQNSQKFTKGLVQSKQSCAFFLIISPRHCSCNHFMIVHHNYYPITILIRSCYRTCSWFKSPKQIYQ